jgi:DNA-binding NtrC family response regulator
LTPDVATAFGRYNWPGNVRELRNVIERALILEDDELITTKYLPPGFIVERVSGVHGNAQAGMGGETDFTLPPEGISLDEVEMSLVRQAFAQSGGNQTRAAELLGISRDQLRYRLKKLDGAAAAIEAS